MANYSYKRNTTTSLKAKGYLDVMNGMLEIDGEPKSITELFKDFDGAFIDVTIKVVEEEDLAEEE